MVVTIPTSYGVNPLISQIDTSSFRSLDPREATTWIVDITRVTDYTISEAVETFLLLLAYKVRYPERITATRFYERYSMNHFLNYRCCDHPNPRKSRIKTDYAGILY